MPSWAGLLGLQPSALVQRRLSLLSVMAGARGVCAAANSLLLCNSLLPHSCKVRWN